mmetsp:Transcript_44676/g.59273  ORF Transcript_44676/g.59273 Transcript_44676/m.59273 type:complete len:179 (+) Transcript_44676:22-558(+)
MGNWLRKLLGKDDGGRRPPPPPVETGPRSIKVVLVGASTVGKTCLIVNYNTGAFNEDRVPNVLDVFRGSREFQGNNLDIEIVDTSGDTQLGTYRQLVYPGTDCFMLCVAVNNRDSMERIRNLKAEIKTVNPNAPILLVATKFDTREQSDNPIMTPELESARLDHGFQGICETSARNWQ